MKKKLVETRFVLLLREGFVCTSDTYDVPAVNKSDESLARNTMHYSNE